MGYPAEDTRISELRSILRRRLNDLYKDRLREVVLFGSYARGEAHAESDLDVLVVLQDQTDRSADEEPLVDLAVEFLERYGIVVSPVTISETDFQRAKWPLLINVREEGVPL